MYALSSFKHVKQVIWDAQQSFPIGAELPKALIPGTISAKILV